MFAAGKGVQRDGIEASAWFRLAAERGNKQFVKISNQVLESMTPAQRQLSDSVYLPLRQQFSDVAILLNSARADYDSLQAQTTTTGGDIMVSNLRPESPVANRNSAKHYRDLEKQMNSKLGQVADELGIKKSSIDYDEPDWQMLNDQVVEHLNKLD